MKQLLQASILFSIFSVNLYAGQLKVGTATTDITPSPPVALVGQFYLRIADTIETPLTANVVALESREENELPDMAIMVSCDVVTIPNSYTKLVRTAVKKQLPELDVQKIFLNATHSHTSPVLEHELNPSLLDFLSPFTFPLTEEGIARVTAYQTYFVQQVTEAIVKAWESRAPGCVTWGLGHASVANNRRVVYSKEAIDPGPYENKTAAMYGNTNSPEFMNLESMADDDVNTLFFWNNSRKLVAITIAVACPAQVIEGNTTVNADYWHPVREKLKQRFGPDLCVLGWISAAGDQSPHLLYRVSAEDRMRELRKLSRLEEIARRIVLAVEETYEAVKNEGLTDIKFTHKAEVLDLPMYRITEQEYLFAKSEQERYAALLEADPSSAWELLAHVTWNADVVKRYEVQEKESLPMLETEVHVIRLGDIVICTNPYEIFTDYGIRMQARSKALQTFTIQLVGPGHYVPTAEAVKGGSYSAIPQSCPLGPEGGQILVDRTEGLINELFPVEY